MGIYYDMTVIYRRKDDSVAAILSDDQLRVSAFWAAGPALTTGRVADPMDLAQFVDLVPGGYFYKVTTMSDTYGI